MTENEKEIAKTAAVASVGAGVDGAGGATVGVLELAAQGLATGLTVGLATASTASSRSASLSRASPWTGPGVSTFCTSEKWRAGFSRRGALAPLFGGCS